MLEIDQESLLSYSVEDKQFWINAVTAAMKAAEHALEQSNNTTNSWSKVMRDGKFKTPNQQDTSDKDDNSEQHSPKKTKQNAEEEMADDVDHQAEDTASQEEEPTKQRKKRGILEWLHGKKEEATEVKEQPKEITPAATKRKHEILERHKDERKTTMARAVGMQIFSAPPF